MDYTEDKGQLASLGLCMNLLLSYLTVIITTIAITVNDVAKLLLRSELSTIIARKFRKMLISTTPNEFKPKLKAKEGSAISPTIFLIETSLCYFILIGYG